MASLLNGAVREQQPIWDQNNPVGTETLQSMRAATPLMNQIPVGQRVGVRQFINPDSGHITAEGQERMSNPALGFDTGGVGGAIKAAAPLYGQKVQPGTIYRGTGAEHGGNLQASTGDIGHGVHFTPELDIAKSYGGGPDASFSRGTREVHSYSMRDMFPEEVAYVLGGKRVGEPVTLVDGNGMHIWRGEWKGENIEKALANEDGIKVVIGAPDSIGQGQILVRDPSLLKPLGQVKP